MRRSTDGEVVAFGAAVIGLVAIFWTSVELQSLGIPVLGVRVVAGLFLVLFVPGALLTRLLGISTDRFGTFVLFSVGFSVAVLTAMNLIASFVLPTMGIENPLSFLPFAFLLTAVLTALLFLAYSTGTTISVPTVRLSGPLPVIYFLSFLPALSVAAVAGMDQFGTNLGMFLFIGTIIGVVVLASTRYLPATLYPFAVFCVSISTLLHRNLLTDHVIGADIQSSYFVSQLLLDTHYWAPDMGGTMMVLAVVTSVPASITTLTGVELATTFKVIYVFVFSLVPVGAFYVNRRLFDDHIALFGSLFFLFYHGSFYFTPGKQLISELFVVLMILVFIQGVDTAYRKTALFVLAVTLVFTHYGMTYVFGVALLGAYVGLALVRRTVGDFDHDLTIWHPIVLLALATAIYAYSSPVLVARIASIPFSIVDLVGTLILTGSIPRSGASYVQNQTGLLDSVNLFLNLLLAALIGIGLSWDVLTQLIRIRRGEAPERVEYNAVAVPLFVLLCSSYFVTANLAADRVYQMVLIVLSPYMVLGLIALPKGLGALLARLDIHRAASVGDGRLAQSPWILVAILLGSLLALNSGLAFALAGTAQISTFNDEANDLAFNNPEREAARWLKGNVGTIETHERFQSPASEADDPRNPVVIYTESRSYQLFRATVSPGYANVEIVRVKSPWQPAVYDDEIGTGYVFIREQSVANIERFQEPSPTHYSRAEIEEIVTPRNVVYSSNAARIVESNNDSVA